MCPYDTDALDPAVVEEALRSHPIVADGRDRADSTSYGGLVAAAEPFREPLRDPPTQPKEFYFEAAGLAALRAVRRPAGCGRGAGLVRTEDLLLAVNEVATNSLRHAHGSGVLRVWEEPGYLICEVRDGGTFDIRSPAVNALWGASSVDTGCGWRTSCATSSRCVRS